MVVVVVVGDGVSVPDDSFRVGASPAASSCNSPPQKMKGKQDDERALRARSSAPFALFFVFRFEKKGLDLNPDNRDADFFFCVFANRIFLSRLASTPRFAVKSVIFSCCRPIQARDVASLGKVLVFLIQSSATSKSCDGDAAAFDRRPVRAPLSSSTFRSRL